jgi:hypothetical protein
MFIFLDLKKKRVELKTLEMISLEIVQFEKLLQLAKARGLGLMNHLSMHHHQF